MDTAYIEKLRPAVLEQRAKLAARLELGVELALVDILYAVWLSEKRYTQKELTQRLELGALRDLRGMVEDLRKDWHVPILSTPHKPWGYWLARSIAESEDFLWRQINTAKAVYTSSVETNLQVAKSCGVPSEIFNATFSKIETRFELRAAIKSCPGLTLKSEKRALELLDEYCAKYSVQPEDVRLTEFSSGRILKIARVV